MEPLKPPALHFNASFCGSGITATHPASLPMTGRIKTDRALPRGTLGSVH
jgi:hypothetical protein